jgi:tetratricopeptide (TPR) repeat protein
VPQAVLLEVVQAALSRDGPAEAKQACARHLALHPDDAAAHRHLALIEAVLGNRGAAARAAERACALAPNDPRCRSDLGRVSVLFGELEPALEHFARAVRLDPAYAEGWHNLGATLRKMGQLGPALVAFKRALAIDPDRAETYLNLGNLLIEAKQFDDAMEAFLRAARLAPDMAAARSRLAERMSARRKVKRAEALFRQSLGLDPDHLPGWLGLARSLEDLGDASGARDAYRNALRRRPRQAVALGALLGLAAPGEVEDEANEAEALLGDAALADGAQALMGYGLAKYRDRGGSHAAAAAAARAANAARRRATGPLDRKALAERVDRLMVTYTQEFFAARKRFGLGTDQPVFIVGLPRSGTTLTEQIIAAHPRLHGAGELDDLARLAAALAEPPWRAGALLDEPKSHQIGAAYLKALRQGARAKALRISDKAPLNFFQLAFAALLFPGARILHCRRAARDNALSIYLENFNVEQRYATDFGDLAFFMAEYRRLMAHWRDALPLPLLDVDYEATVSDPEHQARRIMAFLDVPWDSRCLGFHRSTRAVQTPSRWQVRRPIYADSIARWRHYAIDLPELIAAFPE